MLFFADESGVQLREGLGKCFIKMVLKDSTRRRAICKCCLIHSRGLNAYMDRLRGKWSTQKMLLCDPLLCAVRGLVGGGRWWWRPGSHAIFGWLTKQPGYSGTDTDPSLSLLPALFHPPAFHLCFFFPPWTPRSSS